MGKWKMGKLAFDHAEDERRNDGGEVREAGSKTSRVMFLTAHQPSVGDSGERWKI